MVTRVGRRDERVEGRGVGGGRGEDEARDVGWSASAGAAGGEELRSNC